MRVWLSELNNHNQADKYFIPRDSSAQFCFVGGTKTNLKGTFEIGKKFIFSHVIFKGCIFRYVWQNIIFNV